MLTKTPMTLAQRLDLFRAEIPCVLADATREMPGSVAVSLDTIGALLHKAFPGELELRDPSIVKTLMTITASATIGKALPIIGAEEKLEWSKPAIVIAKKPQKSGRKWIQQIHDS